MGWRGRGRWPGRGPFSDLPPRQRPGWVYGRGACWWLAQPSPATGDTVPTPPFIPTMTTAQETALLERQKAQLQAQLDAIKQRIEELKD